MQFSRACMCVVMAVSIHVNLNHGMNLKLVPKSEQADTSPMKNTPEEHIMKIKKSTVNTVPGNITLAMAFKSATINAILEEMIVKAKFEKNIVDEKKVRGVKVLRTTPDCDDLFDTENATIFNDSENDANVNAVLIVEGTLKKSDADNKDHCIVCIILSVIAVSLTAGLFLSLLFWYCEMRQYIHHLHRINTPRRKAIANLKRKQKVEEKKAAAAAAAAVPLFDDILRRGATALPGTKRAREHQRRLNSMVYAATRSTAFNGSLEGVERVMHPNTWRYAHVTDVTDVTDASPQTSDEAEFDDEVMENTSRESNISEKLLPLLTNCSYNQDEPVPSDNNKKPRTSGSSPVSHCEYAINLNNDFPSPARIAMHINCDMHHSDISPISELQLPGSYGFNESGFELNDSSASITASMVNYLDMLRDLETIEIPDLFIEDLTVEEALGYYDMLVFMGMLDQEVDDVLGEEAARLFFGNQPGLDYVE